MLFLGPIQGAVDNTLSNTEKPDKLEVDTSEIIEAQSSSTAQRL